LTRIPPLGKGPASSSAEASVATIERAARIAIDALKELGVRDEYAVLVGGGALGKRSALAIGADAYCRDLSMPVKAAKTFAARGG
jgi:methanogenic corrinoid protein MtbC1